MPDPITKTALPQALDSDIIVLDEQHYVRLVQKRGTQVLCRIGQDEHGELRIFLWDRRDRREVTLPHIIVGSDGKVYEVAVRERALQPCPDEDPQEV